MSFIMPCKITIQPMQKSTLFILYGVQFCHRPLFLRNLRSVTKICRQNCQATAQTVLFNLETGKMSAAYALLPEIGIITALPAGETDIPANEYMMEPANQKDRNSTRLNSSH